MAEAALRSSVKDDGRMMSTPANRFAAALCCVLGGSALGTTLAIVLILAHHPVVCHSERGAQSLWRGIVKRAFGGIEGISGLLRDKDIAMDVATSILKAIQGQAMSDRCGMHRTILSRTACVSYLTRANGFLIRMASTAQMRALKNRFDPS